MAERARHGALDPLPPCTVLPGAEPRVAPVVGPEPGDDPDEVDGPVTSGPVVPGRCVVGPSAVVGPDEGAVVVATVVPEPSRSWRPISLDVSGAGRVTVTSRATRWTATLTPNTISAVAATQATKARRPEVLTGRACDRRHCGRVKGW